MNATLERRGRVPAAAALLAAAALAAGGCAKTPTVVATDVTADATVPPLLLLRITLASTTQPEIRSSSSFVSTVPDDAGTRPAPLPFPMRLPVTVDSAFGSRVIINLEGLLWDDGETVLASGTTMADAVAGQQTSAAITLTAGGLTCGDGTRDPGERCDDGNRTAGDGCSPVCLDEAGAGDGGADAGSDAAASD